MINFYQRFLSNNAQVLAPLTNAPRGPGKSLLWSPVLDSTFRHAKLLLASVPVLTDPVDASNSHVGAVLQQTSPWLLVPPHLFLQDAFLC